MKSWQRMVFGLLSLGILLVVGLKLHELDMPAARFVRSLQDAELNRLGDLLAIPGEGGFLTGLFVLLVLVAWSFQSKLLKKVGVHGLLALVGTTLVTQLLKHLIGRPRPRFDADVFSLGPSMAVGWDAFPSGHTVNAFAAATVIAWFLPKLRISVFLIAGLVGLSRVVRGSHFPTDVLGGIVLGVLIGGLAAAGFRRWREEALPGLVRTGMPILVSAFLVLWLVLHPTPPNDLWHLETGTALILAGILLRGFAGDHLWQQAAGTLALVFGIAVASGPWWAAGLMLLALVPFNLIETGQPHHLGTTLPPWKREALALSVAILGMTALRAVRGILPLAS